MIFNLCLAAVLVLGLLWPGPGLALAEQKRVLIVTVMFLMSVTLPAERLRKAIGNVRGLAVAGLVNHLVLPLACGLLAWVLFPERDDLRAGMTILGALPCTLSSATVWTRLARGDDALALTFTVLSNLATIVAVPLWLIVFLGEALPVPVAQLLTDLAIVVLAPVLVGQVLRRFLGARADRWKPAISVIARGLVLSIVLVAVSRMQARIHDSPLVVGQLAVVGGAVHGVALAAGWWLARGAGLPRTEQIAVAFAGSQKTLFVGVFLAVEYFPNWPLALLPVTAYHVVQLVIDTLVANRCSRSSST